MPRLLVRLALLAALLLPPVSAARADSLVSALATSSTSPLPASSCLYVDQAGTTDTKLCSGSPLGSSLSAAFGSLAISLNLGDLQSTTTARANLGLGSFATLTPGTLTNTDFCTSDGTTVLCTTGFSGTGNVARVTSPAFTTPNIGTATGHATLDCALTGCTMTGNIAMGADAITGASQVRIDSALSNVSPLLIQTWVLGGSNTASGIHLVGSLNTTGNTQAILAEISNTAVGSNTTSKLMDLRAGATGVTSEFSIDMLGDIAANGTTFTMANLGSTGTIGGSLCATSGGIWLYESGINCFAGGAGASTYTIANEGSTGTTVNKLAKLTGAPSTAIITATTDSPTATAIGIVTSGAGTTSNAAITYNGSVSCVFDGATTAGHTVGLSTTVAGDCHDLGATPPQGQIVGTVTTTNGSGGTYAVLLNIPPDSSLPNPTATGQMLNSSSATAVGWSATPTLGASGTVGTLALGNATSGTVTLGTVSGALGSATASLPANTGTIC